MNQVLERAKRIMTSPYEAIISIKKEETTISILFSEYMFILSSVPAVATFLGWWSSYRFSFGKSFVIALFFSFFVLLGVWLTSYLLSVLAPNFNLEVGLVDGFKIATIAWTPYFVSCVLNLLPRLSGLTFFAVLYGIYLFHTASKLILDTPKDKNTPLTAMMGAAMLVLWYLGRLIYHWG